MPIKVIYHGCVQSNLTLISHGIYYTAVPLVRLLLYIFTMFTVTRFNTPYTFEKCSFTLRKDLDVEDLLITINRESHLKSVKCAQTETKKNECQNPIYNIVRLYPIHLSEDYRHFFIYRLGHLAIFI